MTVSVLELTYVPVLVWIGLGAALLATYRRSGSTLVLRLAAVFLATWALLATSALVWVLSNGGEPAVVRLLSAPLTIFDERFLRIWLIGALGTFLVFLLAFLLSQLVARAFLLLWKPEQLTWPAGVPCPAGSPPSLFRFRSPRVEAFTFTLLERGRRGRLRRRDVVLVSDGLFRELTEAEREAVLAHELGHIRGLDGRYLTFFRTLSRMMRWDPVLAYLAHALTEREEFRADLRAVELTRRPRVLARALYKALSQAPASSSVLPGLLGARGRGGRRATLERIHRLVALAESGEFPEDVGA